MSTRTSGRGEDPSYPLRDDAPTEYTSPSWGCAQKSGGASAAFGHECRKTPLTEYPYMPLEEAEITHADVDAFWSDHPHDLNAPPDVALSNCVYCFLKGTKALRRLREYMNETIQTHPELAKEWAGTPSDWRWWAALEARYARDLDAGDGSVSPLPVEAEALGSLCYDTILHTANERVTGVNTIDMVPCDCTD